MTKQESRRRGAPTGTEPYWPQSTWAHSPRGRLQPQEGGLADGPDPPDVILEDAVAARVTLRFELLEDLLRRVRMAVEQGEDLVLERVELARWLGARARRKGLLADPFLDRLEVQLKTGMGFAPLPDPLPVGRVPEAVSIGRPAQPAPRAGGLAGPPAVRGATVKLASPVTGPRREEKTAAPALAAAGREIQRAQAGRKRAAPANQKTPDAAKNQGRRKKQSWAEG